MSNKLTREEVQAFLKYVESYSFVIGSKSLTGADVRLYLEELEANLFKLALKVATQND